MNFSLSSLYEWYRSAIHHPKYRWWVMLGTAVYLVSPIDILPDIFPIIGQIDDVVLAGLLFTELSQLALTKLQSRQATTTTEDINTDNVNSDTGDTVDVDAETVSVN